ncbi:MAG: hypothetical protein JO257_12600 [Deltaproteobacteria bacterium]|nr:hypothetical protein [Deltaproteobacteria bacterium]
MPDAPYVPDFPDQGCQPVGVTGEFLRRTGNPRLVAGTHPYMDGMVDIGMSDPDLHWDGSAWQMYFHGPHAASFSSPITQMVRHATSSDALTWTLDETPSLVASSDTAAWDHTNTETPTVIENPAAPPDRRFVMLYSGANGMFPGYSFPGYAIGVAFSADGKTFTRLPASESPHAKDGLVLTARDVYQTEGVVADPEIALVGGTFHLWFSSFSCDGTSCATVRVYGVAHATSTDAIHWNVAEAPVRSLLRASADLTTGGGQPSVVYDDVHCRWELWQTADQAHDTDAQPIVFNNMAGVWHATSMDGTTWSINYNGTRDLAWMQSAPGEHLGLLTGVDVAAMGRARYMMYGAFDDQNVPSGFFLPDRSQQGYEPGVMTLDLATRDAP